MQSLKPGRGPSAMAAAGGVVSVVFGIGWTIIAYNVTRNAPFGFGIFFPLFGLAFVILGIVKTIYSFRNATATNRMSDFDLTNANEEPDPLNRALNATPASTDANAASIDERLARLDTLRARGAISEAEHAAQRKRILEQL